MSDRRGQYLIPTRSETRGLVSIGILAIALFAGGGTQSDESRFLGDITHTTHADAEPSAPLPSLTPIAAIEAQTTITPVSPVFEGLVTHYGIQYNGSRMGCVGEPYSSDNETIIAVGPVDAGEWPCGTQLRVCGQSGCVVGTRQDSCPGCGSFHLDLSEAGIALVCGDQAHVCRVGIEEVLIELPPPELPAEGVQVVFRDPPTPVTLEFEPVKVPAPELRTALTSVP